ncbi:hypothetical protein H4Q26_013442 [Puccinia striiformis f. sp. tritici PST-130]|nr:hypothetical protein H4Q26_013442 [Puccinia striiformis f. sp. tritici PST-130]
MHFATNHSTLPSKMFYTILLIALLFIPSQSAIRSVTGTTITPFTTGKIVNQGKPLNEAKYADSDKAVILLGHDGTIKPLRGTNDLEDQKRINAALEKLAADPRNEIWLVSARDVKSLEKTYGHIDNLNFAGYLGGQLSKKNIHDIQLPEVGEEFKELKEDASKIFSANGIPFKVRKGRNGLGAMLIMMNHIKKVLTNDKDG